LFGLERANTDLLMFALVALAGGLWLRPPPARLAGYPIIFLAGLLKFYPLALLAVAVRERPAHVLGIIVLADAGLASFVGLYADELRRMIPNVAITDYFRIISKIARLPVGADYLGDMFGAVILPRGIGFIVKRAGEALLLIPHGEADRLLSFYLPNGLLALLILAALGVAGWITSRKEIRLAFARLPQREAMFLVIGAALVCGSFFAHESIPYRAVVLLFTLPGLFILARTAGTPGHRRLFLGAALMSIFVLWGGFRKAAHIAIVFTAVVAMNLGHQNEPTKAWWLAAEVVHDVSWILEQLAWCKVWLASPGCPLQRRCSKRPYCLARVGSQIPLEQRPALRHERSP
jgi:hypothetical protein